ncbi:MAG: thiol-disulfide oxidoreductase DCC family protein [Rhodospirillaceae bacterium]|nr:thiol-disulfide oxidoreductase DCC family protein [Rhodospirillaceae bacterium]MDE0000491.1 thiol-disulfide oxidoreductase DCC family protein [Rhodospirillaceae bacterium]
MQPDSHIVVFDGMCNLCSSVVDFISARDSRNAFTYLPMQSPRGQQLLTAHGVSIDRVDTFLLIGNGDALVKSDAAIAIAAELRRPWNLLATLRLVPRPIRDGVYSFVAKNRYRWFGKRATCKLPE